MRFPKADVEEGCRDGAHSWTFVGLGHDQGGFLSFQKLKCFIEKPSGMTKFKGQRGPLGVPLQKMLKDLRIFPEIGRKLNQQGAQFLAQGGHTF